MYKLATVIVWCRIESKLNVYGAFGSGDVFSKTLTVKYLVVVMDSNLTFWSHI